MPGSGGKHRLGELLTPSVHQAAKAALGGVGTPTLLTRAIAGTKDVGARTRTPTPLTLRLPLTELLGRGDVPRTLLLLLLLALTNTRAAPLLGTTPTGSTSSATAASTSATTASSAPTAAAATTSAAATTTTTASATTPTATPTPSAASTSTSTAPSYSTRALAPLALARAAPPARGRRRADRLKTKQVGRSSRGNRGHQGGRRTPLKDGGARVTTRGSYSNDALLCCQEGLLEEVDSESGGTD
ncbi:unnamed protein product [Closterium sp. NIES-65]|nr:unnamed protein product [Closterium sp. NIES-65]